MSLQGMNQLRHHFDQSPLGRRSGRVGPEEGLANPAPAPEPYTDKDLVSAEGRNVILGVNIVDDSSAEITVPSFAVIAGIPSPGAGLLAEWGKKNPWYYMKMINMTQARELVRGLQ